MVPETVSHFIGGRHVRSALGKTSGVADPATGKEYAQVAVGIAGALPAKELLDPADGQLRDAQLARLEPAAEPGRLP